MSDDADRPAEWQYQTDIIYEVLDGTLDPVTAAPKLAAVTLPDPISDVDNEEDEDDIMVNIERMFNYMIWALETHPGQVRTIFDLIMCMSQLPPALTVSGRPLCETDPPGRVWEDVPRLGRGLGGVWSGGLIRRDYEDGKGFTAANELVGLLMIHDEKKFDYRMHALWTIRDALEHPLPNPSSPSRQTWSLYHLPAAIKLIETVGDKIYQWCCEAEDRPADDSGPAGPLWDGGRGFCKKRWQFWKKRFHESSSEILLKEEHQIGARTAFDTMEQIEWRSPQVQIW